MNRPLPQPELNPVFLQEPPADAPVNLVELEDLSRADDLAARFNPFDSADTNNLVRAEEA